MYCGVSCAKPKIWTKLLEGHSIFIIMKNIQRIIRSGDRLYASLSVDRDVVASGELTGVTDMTDLIAKVRKGAGRVCGLARLYVKSLTRGWTLTRPLMLYPEKPSVFEGRQQTFAVRPAVEGPRFPWEL